MIIDQADLSGGNAKSSAFANALTATLSEFSIIHANNMEEDMIMMQWLKQLWSNLPSTNRGIFITLVILFAMALPISVLSFIYSRPRLINPDPPSPAVHGVIPRDPDATSGGNPLIASGRASEGGYIPEMSGSSVYSSSIGSDGSYIPDGIYEYHEVLNRHVVPLAVSGNKIAYSIGRDFVNGTYTISDSRIIIVLENGDRITNSFELFSNDAFIMGDYMLFTRR